MDREKKQAVTLKEAPLNDLMEHLQFSTRNSGPGPSLSQTVVKKQGGESPHPTWSLSPIDLPAVSSSSQVSAVGVRVAPVAAGTSLVSTTNRVSELMESSTSTSRSSSGLPGAGSASGVGSLYSKNNATLGPMKGSNSDQRVWAKPLLSDLDYDQFVKKKSAAHLSEPMLETESPKVQQIMTTASKSYSSEIPKPATISEKQKQPVAGAVRNVPADESSLGGISGVDKAQFNLSGRMQTPAAGLKTAVHRPTRPLLSPRTLQVQTDYPLPSSSISRRSSGSFGRQDSLDGVSILSSGSPTVSTTSSLDTLFDTSGTFGLPRKPTENKAKDNKGASLAQLAAAASFSVVSRLPSPTMTPGNLASSPPISSFQDSALSLENASATAPAVTESTLPLAGPPTLLYHTFSEEEFSFLENLQSSPTSDQWQLALPAIRDETWAPTNPSIARMNPFLTSGDDQVAPAIITEEDPVDLPYSGQMAQSRDIVASNQTENHQNCSSTELSSEAMAGPAEVSETTVSPSMSHSNPFLPSAQSKSSTARIPPPPEGLSRRRDKPVPQIQSPRRSQKGSDTLDAPSVPESGQGSSAGLSSAMDHRPSESVQLSRELGGPFPSGESCALTSSPSPRDHLGVERKLERTLSQPTTPRESVNSTRRGIYMSPCREAVHPDRPVCLDIRPRPMRTVAQGKAKARALACTSAGAIWAADQTGIQVWDLRQAMEGASGSREHEEAAPFRQLAVQGARVNCLIADEARGVVWSGHKDGRVRAWRLDATTSSSASPASILMWQAHRSSVLALTVTSYGELWTGAVGGSMKAWPCEATSRALSGKEPSAGEYLAQTAVDLRGRAGNANQSPGGVHSDVRFLLTDWANGQVWSGGLHAVALWDARQRTMLKVLGPNAQQEFAGLSSGRGSYGWDGGLQSTSDEGATMMTDGDRRWSQGTHTESLPRGSSSSGGRRERREGWGFFTRSRTAVIGAVGGAADAVRRAAQGGQEGMDMRKLGGLVAAPDGTIWAAYRSGLLFQWDRHGGRLQELQPGGGAMHCICSVGTRLWLGYADGKIAVLSSRSGKRLGGWEAHSQALVHVALCGDHVVTLATHGGIRAWSASSPSIGDAPLRAAMAAHAEEFTLTRSIRILTATWNVAEERPSRATLGTWLRESATGASLVVVALQEMEVGAGTIAMAAAKETVGMGLQEKGSAHAQWWLTNLSLVLGETSFERIASRQLAGMLIAVWVRRNLLSQVGEVEAGVVACGFGRALGTKGAVAVRLSIFRRTVCVLNSHLAAHQDAVVKRNQDWARIYHHMAFGRTQGAVGTAATNFARVAGGGLTSAVNGIRKVAQGNRGSKASFLSQQPEPEEEVEEYEEGTWLELDALDEGSLPMEGLDKERPELADADLLIWCGDLNYRIDNVASEDLRDAITRQQWAQLLRGDQLLREQAAGRTLRGMREPSITFPPTYKFDKGSSNPLAYDSSEKRRLPAWCDRVLFRDSFDFDGSGPLTLVNPVHATPVLYDSCMEALDSDHKPLRCLLDVDIASIDHEARRRLYSQLVRSGPQVAAAIQSAGRPPCTVVSTRRLLLEGRAAAQLRLTNESSREPALFMIRCEGEPAGRECGCGIPDHGHVTGSHSAAGTWGFPSWLQVVPAAGLIPPQQSIAIDLFYMDRGYDSLNGQMDSWRADERRDKAAALVVLVGGALSAKASQHRLCVCHGESVRRLSTGMVPPSQDIRRSPPQSPGRHPSFQPKHPAVTDCVPESCSPSPLPSKPAGAPAGEAAKEPGPVAPARLVVPSQLPLPDLLQWD